MIRVLLAVAVWGYAINPMAVPADGPGDDGPAQPAATTSAPTNLNPVYVKAIWPDDPATPVTVKDHPVVESWIVKSIQNRNQTSFTAVTAWVPLIEGPLKATELWDGKLDGVNPACDVVADVFERQDGLIKICFRGWTPYGSEAIVTLKDEPGSREVVPVTQAKKKHGTPHVAIFIGLQAKAK